MKFMFFVLILMSGLGVQAQTAPVCGRSTAHGYPYQWCIDRNLGSRNPDVLYFLHGGGGSERSWFDSSTPARFKAAWRRLGVDAPTVITFSFGKQWLLGDVATAEHPALLPIVLKTVMPQLEGQIGGLKGRRMVMGNSMGGYNSFALALRAPHLFTHAAPLCPGVMSVSPDSSKAEIEAFLKRNSPKVNPDRVTGILNWIREDFQTSANWQRHDPLKLMNLVNRNYPEFFVTASWDDDYGFFEGTKIFADNLRARGLKIHADLRPRGGHCEEIETAIPRLAAFLTSKKTR